jgi:prepilin-type N-terminal cleavage/methylation domain-containing protein/prepilin-type processing-associated H-X9-DG protein
MYYFMKNKRFVNKKGGFTLVELLTVIAVTGVLMGVLLPVLGRVRSKAGQTVCLSNLRQLAMAANLYADLYSRYPRAWEDAAADSARWMDKIKPYIGKDSGVYWCPADKVKQPMEWDKEIIMSYGINTFNFSGQRYCFWYGVKRDDVASPSETIIFADCTPGKYYCGGGAWREPVLNVDYRHNGGFAAAFCDGHSDFLKTTEKRYWDASKQ